MLLEEQAKSTPVFAPGVDNVAGTGAVAAVLDSNISLATQVEALLVKPIESRQPAFAAASAFFGS